MKSMKIRDMCSLVVDCPHSTPVWTDTGALVFRSQNIRNGRLDLSKRSHTTEHEYKNRVRRAVPSPGDLIITREAPMGEVAIIPHGVRGCLGQRMVLLRPDTSKTDPRFLLYAMMSPMVQNEIKTHEGTGSTVSNLRIPALEVLEIPTPSLSEQRAIAHILGTLDDNIELNRRMSETLEAMARALFKSWFVDFDPVRAKAEGRDPGLPKHIVDLFPDSFEDSELGEIPKGWGAGPLSTMAELMIGGDWGRDTAESDNVPVRCLRGVDVDRIRKSGWSDAPIRCIKKKSFEKRAPAITDILVEGSGECGRAIAFEHLDQLFDEPVLYSNFCKRLRCSSPAFAYYVEFVLNNLVRTAEMKNFVTGTAMPNLDHKGLLTGLWVVRPPSRIVDAFASFASASRKRLYSEESRTLAALRDTLLPKLISGELRVPSLATLVM